MMMVHVLFLLVLLNFWGGSRGDTFNEELIVRPLQDGKIMAHFHFTIDWELEEAYAGRFEHYRLFPKSIGQIVDKFGIEELHLSFTQGRWNQIWGEPIPGFPFLPAPVGVQLWTWFKALRKLEAASNESTENAEIDGRWKDFTSALSGIFCASLEQMNLQATSSPYLSFGPTCNSTSDECFDYRRAHDPQLLRYSILPRETVCTENLTPWMKLLPCRSKGGIAALLNSFVLYDVDFHSMGTHLFTTFQGNNKPALQLLQTLTLVFNAKDKEVSFQSLFGKSDVSGCPLAETSSVRVEIPSAFPFEVELNPRASSIVGNVATYDLKKAPLALTVIKKKTENTTKQCCTNLRKLSSNRYLRGYGQEFGEIVVDIFNTNDEDIFITYFDQIPWYLRVYFHTFTVFLNSKEVDPLETFDTFIIKPGQDHGSPNVLEFGMLLRAKSRLSFFVQFEKAFLHWTEHPPDPNRGFDIGSALIVGYTNGTISSSETVNLLPSQPYHRQNSFRIYTDGLLVTLPLPDFSMPYNVITLTGTVFALFFGSTLNVLVRRMRHLDRVNNDFVSNRPVARLIRKITSFIEE